MSGPQTPTDRTHSPASGLLTASVFGMSLVLLSLLSSAPVVTPPSASLATAAATAGATVIAPATVPPEPTATPSPTADLPATETAAAAGFRATQVAQAGATTAARVTQAATTVARYTAEARLRQEATAQSLAEATAAAAAASATAEAAAALRTSAPETVAQADATPEPTVAPAPEAEAPAPEAAPPVEPAAAAHPQVPRLVLASYLAWYDADGWDDCNISGGDRPAEPYGSDDPAAIGRHVQQALGAGIDGFLLHWFAPGERTDANMAQLLAQSGGTGFQSSVVFLRHLWHGSPGPSQDSLVEALSYLIGTYGGHPNFLRLDGKPVIFFADMQRVPGGSPVEAWRAIRDRVDPQRQTWWIVEGLDPSYLSVFDGLYVYKITHATDPACYAKAGRWAESVRAAEATYGSPKLWVGTISPGYDDTRAGCRSDARVPSAAQRRERDSGSFYRATYDAAAASGPDWLLVQSWNEWVEGTYVEPSAQYGDLYLQLTREFAAAFK